jgi:tetratricopeptide (TPR) repeat protein
MTKRKESLAHTSQLKPFSHAPAEPGNHSLRKIGRKFAWIAVPALAVGLIGLGAWYWAAQAIPDVQLDAYTDPALAEAVSQARWAIRRAPWSDRPRGHMAMLLHVHGMHPVAAEFYTQAESLNVAEPRWPYLHSFVVADSPPTALALLRKAAGLVANRSDAPDAPLARWGEVCLEQEQLEEADEAFQKLLERLPNNARAHLGLARLAVLRSQFDQAIPHLKACATNPMARKAAATLLAEVLERRGEPEAASRTAQQAAQHPRDLRWPDPWLDQARALLVGRNGRKYRMAELQNEGRLQEALELEKEATIEEYPDMGWIGIGLRRLDEGKWVEAENAFRQAVGLNEASAEGYFNLGRALFAQKKFGDAAASFRKVMELQPANGSAYRELARCAAAQGDRPEAIRQLRQAVRYTPHDADANRELGELLLAEGEREEAMRYLSQALRLNGKDQKVRSLLEELQRGPKAQKP